MKLVRPAQLERELKELYDSGLPSGDKTGWPAVDELYTVVPGQLTIITGFPGSGKSQWLDALCLNLSDKGWLFAVHSPENMPKELHLAKWVSQYIRKPFREGRTERLTWDEAKEAMFDLSKHFAFISPKGEEAMNIGQILEAATILFDDDFSGMKHGLIIDPWNEVSHSERSQHFSETEYIGQCLSLVRRWARERKTHVWIVAHPQKLKRDDGHKLPIPTPDSISSSMNWWNKADCCLTIHRDQIEGNQDVDVHVQKIRFAHVGRTGVCTLRFDRVTGRYHSILRSVGDVRGVE